MTEPISTYKKQPTLCARVTKTSPLLAECFSTMCNCLCTNCKHEKGACTGFNNLESTLRNVTKKMIFFCYLKGKRYLVHVARRCRGKLP